MLVQHQYHHETALFGHYNTQHAAVPQLSAESFYTPSTPPLSPSPPLFDVDAFLAASQPADVYCGDPDLDLDTATNVCSTNGGTYPQTTSFLFSDLGAQVSSREYGFPDLDQHGASTAAVSAQESIGSAQYSPPASNLPNTCQCPSKPLSESFLHRILTGKGYSPGGVSQNILSISSGYRASLSDSHTSLIQDSLSQRSGSSTSLAYDADVDNGLGCMTSSLSHSDLPGLSLDSRSSSNHSLCSTLSSPGRNRQRINSGHTHPTYGSHSPCSIFGGSANRSVDHSHPGPESPAHSRLFEVSSSHSDSRHASYNLNSLSHSSCVFSDAIDLNHLRSSPAHNGNSHGGLIHLARHQPHHPPAHHSYSYHHHHHQQQQQQQQSLCIAFEEHLLSHQQRSHPYLHSGVGSLGIPASCSYAALSPLAAMSASASVFGHCSPIVGR